MDIKMNIKELIKQPEGGGLSLKASCRRMQAWQRPLWLLQMCKWITVYRCQK